MKPVNYNYRLEISPTDIFKQMLNHPVVKCKITNSIYLSRRLLIIKSLQQITNKLKYRRQTFFLALFYLDHVFSSFSNVISEFKPELVGLVCLILAGKYKTYYIAKYDENDPVVPYLNDLQTIYPKQFFMPEDLKKCEILVLQCLNYKLNYFTAYHYLSHFALNGFVFSDEVVISNPSTKMIENDKRHSARESGYNSTNHTTCNSVSHREHFSQKNLEKIYSLIKEILVIVIDGKILI